MQIYTEIFNVLVIIVQQYIGKGNCIVDKWGLF